MSIYMIEIKMDAGKWPPLFLRISHRKLMALCTGFGFAEILHNYVYNITMHASTDFVSFFTMRITFIINRLYKTTSY
jgi:hypothetical protein